MSEYAAEEIKALNLALGDDVKRIEAALLRIAEAIDRLADLLLETGEQ